MAGYLEQLQSHPLLRQVRGFTGGAVPQQVNTFIGPQDNNFSDRRWLYQPSNATTVGFKDPVRLNLAGMVNRDYPKTAWILDRTQSTAAHELTHVDQLGAEERLGQSPFKSLNEPKQVKDYKPLSLVDKFIADLQISTRQALNKSPRIGGHEVGINSLDNRMELFATLRELDAIQPKGKRVWDLPEFSGLFSGPQGEEKKRLFEEMLFPQTTFVDQGPQLPPKNLGFETKGVGGVLRDIGSDILRTIQDSVK